MVHISRSIDPIGPLLGVEVGVCNHVAAAMIAAGLTPPDRIFARMLIDTGCSHSSIDRQLVAALNLEPSGTIDVHTPSTTSVPDKVPTYEVSMIIPCRDEQHQLLATTVNMRDFSSQGFDGLLGRDILAKGRLFYSGPDNCYYLSF